VGAGGIPTGCTYLLGGTQHPMPGAEEKDRRKQLHRLLKMGIHTREGTGQVIPSGMCLILG